MQQAHQREALNFGRGRDALVASEQLLALSGAHERMPPALPGDCYYSGFRRSSAARYGSRRGSGPRPSAEVWRATRAWRRPTLSSSNMSATTACHSDAGALISLGGHRPRVTGE